MAQSTEEATIPAVSIAQAYDWFRQRQATFVDVRSRSDYDRVHIPGSVSLPLRELPRHYKELPSNQPLVIYCA